MSAVKINAPLETIMGVVERVTFHNAENGFCVLRVKVKGQRDLLTVVGHTPNITPGESIECRGRYQVHKTHGQQFSAQSMATLLPTTEKGIEKYLASGMVKGIGPHFAKKLVQAFGEQVFEVIDKQPDRLGEIEGIGEQRREQLIEAWEAQRGVQDIMVFLQSHGIGTARATRIYKTYGDEAIAKLKANPYDLASDIHGIGFKTADALALRMGLGPQSVVRAGAGLSYMLKELSGQGHCAATQEQLFKACDKVFEMPEAVLTQALNDEVQHGRIIREVFEELAYFYAAPLYYAETGVAFQVQRLAQGEKPWQSIDVEAKLAWVQEQIQQQLSDSQKVALNTVVQAKFSIITGGPGVGKTTLLNSVLKILGEQKLSMALCAPTGRAAKRMSESTGRPAKTIHRLLEFNPHGGGFKHNADFPLPYQLIVVDEASMIDVQLMNQLLRAIPQQAAVLLVGDKDQLPSVGPGCVLADLIASHAVPVVRLTEIFRQAASSRIIINAHRINQGEFPLKDPEDKTEMTDFYWVREKDPERIHDLLIHMVSERIPQRFGFDPIRDIQVLTPMNRGGLGAHALNVKLQATLNPPTGLSVERFGTIYAHGDKVIQRVNNYDKEVYNGDLGWITNVNLENSSLSVEIDGRVVSYEFDELDELSLAYATTIHKSQGSEYPVVVIPIAMQQFMLLERNLIYTGITRGKQLVILVGEPKALGMAIKTTQGRERVTHLAKRLRSL